MENYKKIKIEIILISFLVIIFTNNLIDYNLKTQHDAALHHYPILHILTFNFNEISTPYGIFYYVYVALFAPLSFPFLKLGILNDRESFYLMVKLSNIVLYLLSIIYSIKISKLIFGKKNFDYLLPVIFIFSISSLHRSFLMARPENLIIFLVLVSFVYLFKLLNEKKFSKKDEFVFCVILFLIGSAKLNGFCYLLCLFFFLLIFNKKNFLILKISIIVFLSIFFYYFLHSYISLMGIYDRPYGIEFDSPDYGLFKNGKDLSLFIKYSFIDSWNFPIKYNQSDTMLNILALDLYGDYYVYGIEKFRENLTLLNRKGLILSHIFFILYLVSIMFNAFKLKNIIEYNPLLIFFNLLVPAGLFLLIMFTIIEYYGEKNTTVKLEYINFFIIGSCYSITYFITKNKPQNFKKIIIPSLMIYLIFCNLQLIPLNFK